MKCLELIVQVLLLCVLTQCAMLPNGHFQSAEVMQQGGKRLAGQFETGLHIEEAMYSELMPGQIIQNDDGDGAKALRRDLIQKPSIFNILIMSVPGVNFDYAITDKMEIQSMLFGGASPFGNGPAGIGALIGLKKELYAGDVGFSSLFIEGLMHSTIGLDTEESKSTSSEDNGLSHNAVNDKSLIGSRLSWLNTMRPSSWIDFTLTPTIGLYKVEVDEGWAPEVEGEHLVKHFQLSLGSSFYLRYGYKKGRLFIRPELSFARYYSKPSYLVDNITYGIGFGAEMF